MADGIKMKNTIKYFTIFLFLSIILMGSAMAASVTEYTSSSCGTTTNSYAGSATVYVKVGNTSYSNVNVFIVPDRNWNNGDSITGYLASKNNTNLSSCQSVWSPALSGGPYDVIVDADKDGVYDSSAHSPYPADIIDSTSTSGFSVTGNSASFTSQISPPTGVCTGTSTAVSVTMNNNGNTQWTDSGNGYRLGSENPQDNVNWGFNRVYLAPAETIAPGASKTFSFTATAPATAGTYNFQWQMVQDAVEWFGAESTTVPVTVRSCSCSDTDSGDLPNTFGTVSGSIASGTYSYPDACTDITHVREFYCSGITPLNHTVACDSGRYCSSGACVIDNTAPVKATGVNPAVLSYDKTASTVDIADVGTCTDAGAGMHATEPYQVSYSDAGTSPDANCNDNTYTVTSAWGTSHAASFTGTNNHYYCIKLECKDALTNTATYYSANNILYDITAPTLSSVHIESNNANPVIAIVGNTITLTFTASEAISTPTVTIAGHAASVSGSGSGPYTATYVMASGDAAGVIPFSISFSDIAGNAGTAVTSTTDTSSVTFFKPFCLTKNGGTFTNDASVGTIDWTNPSNAQTSNNVYATITTASASAVTHYLKASNFNFDISDGSTINGISVNVERNEGSSTLRVTDNSIRMVKNNIISGSDKSTGVSWPQYDTTIIYGGAADLWSQSWTASDINSATTGFVISAIHDSSTNSRTLSIDYINMTVCYTDTVIPTLPSVHIQSNNANTAIAIVGNTVTLTFTASEAISTPTVTIDGNAAIVSGTGSGPYTATYVMDSGDVDGFVTFSIAFSDVAGNVGTPVTGTTDGSSVRYYAPVSTCVSKEASTFADDTSVGSIAWSNPSNAMTSNNIYATAYPLYNTGVYTHYLKATNFGFNIPTGSTINGISFGVEKAGNLSGGTDTYIVDYRVRMVKSGTIGTTDRADTSTRWSTTDTIDAYGSSSDLWGTTWAAADINSATTGLVFSATKDTTTTNPRIASVDYISMTVCYSYNPTPTSCLCPPMNSNWAINMADNCVLSTNCNLGTGKLSFSGIGSFTINAVLDSDGFTAPPAGSTIWIGPAGRWY